MYVNEIFVVYHLGQRTGANGPFNHEGGEDVFNRHLVKMKLDYSVGN